MIDPRFFPAASQFSVSEIQAKTGSELIGAPSEALITGVAAVQDAGPSDLAVVHNKKYKQFIVNSKAGLILTSADLSKGLEPSCPVLICDKPYLQFALLAAEMFYEYPAVEAGIHPRAIVEPSAQIDASVQVSAGAYVGKNAKLGAGTYVAPNAVIADQVEIGANCQILANASVSHAIIGDRTVIYPNAAIGQRGFGFTAGPSGIVKVPQLGLVRIGNDVEIGAATTVDRGALKDTLIGDGTMIDNLCQIAHNVEIGRFCIIVAQVGIAGSTVLEDMVTIGGHSAINGHIRLATGTQIGAATPVLQSTKPGQEVLDFPPMTPRDAFKRHMGIIKLLKREGLL